MLDVDPVAPDGPALPDKSGWPVLSASRYDSFVVRVVSRQDSGELVQGQVTHVASRRTLRFTDVQRVVGFILTHLHRPGDVEVRLPLQIQDKPASDGWGDGHS